jgi:hypothetical protein
MDCVGGAVKTENTSSLRSASSYLEARLNMVHDAASGGVHRADSVQSSWAKRAFGGAGYLAEERSGLRYPDSLERLQRISVGLRSSNWTAIQPTLRAILLSSQ